MYVEVSSKSIRQGVYVCFQCVNSSVLEPLFSISTDMSTRSIRCLTRHLEPVMYRDFSWSETGTDVPIHDLTLEQLKYAIDIQSPHGNPISVPGKLEDRPIDHRGRQRLRPVCGGFRGGSGPDTGQDGAAEQAVPR